MNTLELSQKVNVKKIANQELGNSVGISGASGFLGLHLIDELSKNKQIKTIKCFIRSYDKFREKKKQFKLSFSEEKLTFYTDIKPEYFDDVGHFIHSAAQLHSIKNCQQLYRDNVELTQTILSYLKGKMHYISTLSVFASSNQTGKHLEQLIDVSNNHNLYGGYAQTKWLSEYLVSQCSQFQILRLGLLTPSTNYPFFQSHEFMSIFIQLMKELKVYPKGYEESYVDISPVNVVAKSIAKEMFLEKKIMHIANEKSTSLSEILKHLNAAPIEKQEWLEKIKSLKKTNQVLLRYAFFKTQALKEYPQYYNIDLFQSTNHDWQGKIENSAIIKTYINNIIGSTDV